MLKFPSLTHSGSGVNSSHFCAVVWTTSDSFIVIWGLFWNLKWCQNVHCFGWTIHSKPCACFGLESLCIWISCLNTPLTAASLHPLSLSAAEPLPLMDLCRRAARLALGRERLQEIETLPLPQSLKNYLQYQWARERRTHGHREEAWGVDIAPPSGRRGKCLHCGSLVES